jgi:hypothetical protein
MISENLEVSEEKRGMSGLEKKEKIAMVIRENIRERKYERKK